MMPFDVTNVGLVNAEKDPVSWGIWDVAEKTLAEFKAAIGFRSPGKTCILSPANAVKPFRWPREPSGDLNSLILEDVNNIAPVKLRAESIIIAAKKPFIFSLRLCL